MSQVIFSISNIIEFSWNKFKEQPVLWISVTVLSLLIGSFSDYGLAVDTESFQSTFNPLGFLAGIVSLYISASLTLMAIKFVKGDTISFNDLLAINFYQFLHFVFVTVISTIVMIFGFFFFILPGFYIMARLIFAQYLVLDKKLPFLEAMRTSWDKTKGHVLVIISFLFAMFFVVILGFLSLLVGLLVAIPVSTLATAQLYAIFFQD
tara:strand:+ start:203 stop:823 length:621 start_codon:yes stop_codon:yes gene_type:complete